MNTTAIDQLVLGVGNELLGDEGVGVHAVRKLKETTLPKGVEVVETGTALLDALPSIERSRRLIVIDAMCAQGSPGAVYRTSLENIQKNSSIASVHGLGILHVLQLANRADMLDGIVFGIEPQYISWSLELSSAVSQSLPFVLRMLQAELRNSEPS